MMRNTGRGMPSTFTRLEAASSMPTVFITAELALGSASGLQPGQRVLVQRNGNVAIDCTDDVHPDVAHAASLAARVVGLDIAGIDMVHVPYKGTSQAVPSHDTEFSSNVRGTVETATSSWAPPATSVGHWWLQQA